MIIWPSSTENVVFAQPCSSGWLQSVLQDERALVMKAGLPELARHMASFWLLKVTRILSLNAGLVSLAQPFRPLFVGFRGFSGWVGVGA